MEEQLAAFRMEFDKFLEVVAGLGIHGSKGIDLMTLGNSILISVHIHNSDGNFDVEIPHFIF